MAARSRSRRSAPKAKADRIDAGSTVIGAAFTMPEAVMGMRALAAESPIDFQARQDSMSSTRRAPDPKLAPKLKRTTARPAKAKETKFEL